MSRLAASVGEGKSKLFTVSPKNPKVESVAKARKRCTKALRAHGDAVGALGQTRLNRGCMSMQAHVLKYWMRTLTHALELEAGI